MNDGGDDQQLAAEITRGSVAALQRVYEAHAGRIFSLARRIIGDGRLAGDVVEEVFVALWERPEDFDPRQGSLGAHLSTLASIRSHELVRNRSGAQEGTGRERLAPDVEFGLLRGEAQVLPEEEERAIELAYFGGYSCGELAQLFDVPEPTVLARIRRGLKRLRLAMPHDPTD
ncbi:MAG: sigma-70 family RNA polymerase sigma factor [Actinomycetota bacterium]|nr:sigma-70 family RNA polymerase sigma factor [Actinomycetota bacterium]